MGAAIALVVAAALAALPVAAQAEPHYYKSGALIAEGEKVPILEWGTLTNTFYPQLSRPITCEYAGGGLVENPVGGGAGKAQTTQLSAYNCVNAECPPGKVTVEGKEYEKEVIVTSASLPWPTVLIEEAGIRIENSGAQVSYGCGAHGLSNTSPPGGTELGKPGAQEQFYLALPTACITTPVFRQKPLAVNGKNSTVTTRVEFDTEAGSLSCAGGAFPDHTSGKLKLIAYKESELITTRNP